ncbi:MAG: hypothetical protein H6745_03785 [Deltaproteobacteria bacterium]|nr:hypothetical protein [Deltaproteobacteria bacterium]
MTRRTWAFLAVVALVGHGGCGDETLGTVGGDAADAIPVDTGGGDDTGAGADTVAPDTVVADTVIADTIVADTADTVAPEDTADTAVADTETGEDTASVDVSDATTATDPCAGQADLPFAPTGATTPWRHSVATPLVLIQGAANHRGQDVVVAAGQPQRLVGKFAYGALDSDLHDEDVEIWVQREPRCGAWEHLGDYTTTENDELGTVWGVEDDGGRVFFEVPASAALGVGRHPVRMLVKGDHTMAAFELIVVEPGTDAVVFDIDGTLTTGDSELLLELAADLFSGSYVPAVQPGGVDVVRAWADKGYLVVYLTGRPDFLNGITRGWLVDQGFPAGAVHLTDTNGQALPFDSGVGDYKAEFLDKEQGAEGGLVFAAAYGNATTDIYGYDEAGVDKARTFIIGDNAGADGTVAVDSYATHLPTAQAMPAATTPAPPSHGWW